MAVILGPTGISVSNYIDGDSLPLDNEQSAAAHSILSKNNISFLTGHAGTFLSDVEKNK